MGKKEVIKQKDILHYFLLQFILEYFTKIFLNQKGILRKLGGIGKKIRGGIGTGDFEEKLGNKLCLGVQILKMRAI